jgi:hypothetical protein
MFARAIGARFETRPGWRWAMVACWSLACVAHPFREACAADPTPASREYEIKAAFIYNFTKFVEWPPQSFPPGTEPIVIAVLGDSPCAAALEDLTKGRKVNGHAILVKRVESKEDAGAAQVLFVGSQAEARFDRIEPAIAAAPVLTVGESPQFAATGGAINFVMQGDKVRFEINLASADQAGVKISAQLLKLALAVHRSG